MNTPYQILGWNNHFENNKSREREKCSFVCVPNKQDGMGLANILAQPDGLAIYGIWQLMIGAASRQGKHRDGWLTDDGHQTGTAWTASDMAVLWRCPEAMVVRAIEVLSGSRVGWLSCNFTEKTASGGQQVPVKCPSSAPEWNRIEEKKNPQPPSGEQAGVRVDNKLIPSTPLAIRISVLFHRKPEKAWSLKEYRAYKTAAPTEEEITLLEAYYAKERARGIEGIHRRDLQTFLNNYRGEIDRARASIKPPKKHTEELDFLPLDWQQFLAAHPEALRIQGCDAPRWSLLPTSARGLYSTWKNKR